jgi:hypothetical protein
VSRRRDEEHRVRVAAIEQALEMGLPHLAAAADAEIDGSEMVELAVQDLLRLLELGTEAEDAIRLAVTAGALIGGVVAAARSR